MVEVHVLSGGAAVSDFTASAGMPIVPPGLAGDVDAMRPVPLAEIRTALAGAMIETRYQPVVRLADRVVVGVEALARLNHPARGTVLPDAFVPQIEDAGLAGQLTELVIACAFADMTGAAMAPLGLSVSLNFPLDVLLRTAALARLETQRQEAGIPVERVIIELTETQPVRDLAALRGAVEHLRRAGYQVVIDDVGPAVAGLDQLFDLPFTAIKLDKTLVLRLDTAPDVVSEVERIIGHAKARGMTVVAEGVETAALWHRARALGIDHAQGFLVAHSLSAAAVPVWLRSWRELPDF
jgi:EAL domain-containing protein (putative c-di-GMP-specific phosphodiesterase class I)